MKKWLANVLRQGYKVTEAVALTQMCFYPLPGIIEYVKLSAIEERPLFWLAIAQEMLKAVPPLLRLMSTSNT